MPGKIKEWIRANMSRSDLDLVRQHSRGGGAAKIKKTYSVSEDGQNMLRRAAELEGVSLSVMMEMAIRKRCQ